MKKIGVITAIVLSLTFGFLFSHNTFALEDVTWTLDASNEDTRHYLCGDTSGVSCDGYRYVIAQVNGIDYNNNNINNISFYLSSDYFYQPNTSRIFYNRFYFNNLMSILEVKSSINNGHFTYLYYDPNSRSFFNSLNSGWSVTFTLTDNYANAPSGTLDVTSNGTYNVSSYEYVDVDIDMNRPFIVDLFENSFWNIATALVALIVPIIALFLIFRLVHDLLFKERL